MHKNTPFGVFVIHETRFSDLKHDTNKVVVSEFGLRLSLEEGRKECNRKPQLCLRRGKDDLAPRPATPIHCISETQLHPTMHSAWFTAHDHAVHITSTCPRYTRTVRSPSKRGKSMATRMICQPTSRVSGFGDLLDRLFVRRKHRARSIDSFSAIQRHILHCSSDLHGIRNGTHRSHERPRQCSAWPHPHRSPGKPSTSSPRPQPTS
jgi:hypothetical protein